MERTAVHVGRAGKPSIWGFAFHEGDEPAIPIDSNYDVLVGYRTEAEQQRALRIFLEAPIETALAECERVIKQETCIFGGRRGKGRKERRS
jgi:hypothetical protein